MFKRVIAIIAVLALSVLSLCGCGGDKYGKINIDGEQDYTATVTSNGGSVVQYGKYLYFINGTRGYEDTEADANVFGEVVKGAVYRAELIDRDPETKLGLKSHKDKNNKNETVDVVDVQRIAPKTAGTSGYKNGGLFIYGDSLYYASPNNLKNKTGSVQYTKTDFFRMTLDGKTTQKIYTTEADSADKPYMFFSHGDFVYLTVLDGTDLISVKLNKKNGKKEDTIKIAEDVTAAVMPAKPVYYDGIDEDTIYDFIYFERAATKTDRIQSGEVLEFVRPDGTSRTIFEAGDSDYTLETVKDGYLFYRKNENGSAKLVARNLHKAFMGRDDVTAADIAAGENALGDEDYKKNSEKQNLSDVNKSFNVPSGDSVTLYPFVQGYEFDKENVTNVISMFAVTGGASIDLYVDGVIKRNILASGASVSIDTVSGNDLFYTADSNLYRVDLSAGTDYAPKTVATTVTAGTFGADAAGGYLMYFANVADDATGYSFFYEIDGLEKQEGGEEGKIESIFAGELAEPDVPSKTDKLEIKENPDKLQYKIGEKLDLKGIVVEATGYADEDGNAPDPEVIEVKDSMVSGFDSSAAGEVTVTITYDKKTVDFTVTILNEEASTGCGTLAPVNPWFFIGGGTVLLLAAGVLVLGKRRQNA